MVRLAITPSTREVVGHRGDPIVLRCRTWTAAVGARRFGGAMTYRQPHRVEHPATGSTATIVDPMMVVRLLTLLALAGAVLVRKARP